MIRKAFQRLAIVLFCIGVIVMLAFWLPRYLWRQDWAAAVSQAKQFYDEADRVVARHQWEFAGEEGKHRAENYDARTFHVKSQPACWTNMVQLAHGLHRPRRFHYFPNADTRPVLFIGDLETESGQSRFVAIELDGIRTSTWPRGLTRPQEDVLELSFKARVMRLNHQTCEFCTSEINLYCHVTEMGREANLGNQIELTTCKRSKDQPLPRFRVHFGSIVSTFEIQLKDLTVAPKVATPKSFAPTGSAPTGSLFGEPEPEDSTMLTIIEVERSGERANEMDDE